MAWTVKTQPHYYVVYDACGHLKEKCACIRPHNRDEITGVEKGYCLECAKGFRLHLFQPLDFKLKMMRETARLLNG